MKTTATSTETAYVLDLKDFIGNVRLIGENDTVFHSPRDSGEFGPLITSRVIDTRSAPRYLRSNAFFSVSGTQVEKEYGAKPI